MDEREHGGAGDSFGVLGRPAPDRSGGREPLANGLVAAKLAARIRRGINGEVCDVHQAVLHSRKAKWFGNTVKENRIRYAIGKVLKGQEGLVEETFEIVKNQPEYRY